MSAEKQLGALDIANQIWQSAKDGAHWVGGMVAGEFNGKQTTGQILTDAVISMFPVAGEVTAARDAIAIGLRLADGSEEDDNVFDWIALVLCLIAVVPLLGGVLKGVGKLVVRAAAKSEDLVKLGTEILAFLRKMGHGDPARWLRQLDFAKYQGEILKAFGRLIDRLKSASSFIPERLARVLPDRVIGYFKALPPKLDTLRRRGERMIPESIKELNRCLNKVREKLIDGSFADISVGKAGTSKAMVHEGRMTEKAIGEAIPSKGHLPAPEEHYKHEPGWPDLRYKLNRRTNVLERTADSIASFSTKSPIQSITIRPREGPIFRVVQYDFSQPAGLQEAPRKVSPFWAEALPKNGKAWRLDCAVKQGWSKNGAYLQMDQLPTADELKALGIQVPLDWDGMRVWRGKIAEQVDDVTGLLLPGGEIQLFVDFSHPHNRPIAEYIERQVNIKPTNWNDVSLPEHLESTVDYLHERERSAKIQQEGYVARGMATTGKQANNNRELP